MYIKKVILKFYKRLIFIFKIKINLDKQKLDLKSLNELFNHFGTDKGTEVIDPYAKKYDHSNKRLMGHGYGNFYESHLDIYKNTNIKILEIGTWKGAGVAAFYHYFKKAMIFCIDRNFKFQYKSKRVNFFNMDTENIPDVVKLENFLKKKRTEYLDVIIDDGSHKYLDILNNFKNFFKRIKPGGYYIIEDFNHYKQYPKESDLPNNFLDIEDILQHLKKKVFFNSTTLNKEFQSFCFVNISDITIHKGNEEFSYIAFIKKNS
jgi:hypothetical protein|tara:strand:+ start:2574 stop:3359 length:786 start_codon:yes stop_codon:yes gene_type:complete